MKSIKTLSKICKDYLEEKNLLDEVEENTITLLISNEIMDLIKESIELVSLSTKEYRVLSGMYGEFPNMSKDEIKYNILIDVIDEILINGTYTTIAKVKKMRLERSI